MKNKMKTTTTLAAALIGALAFTPATAPNLAAQTVAGNTAFLQPVALTLAPAEAGGGESPNPQRTKPKARKRSPKPPRTRSRP